MAKKKKSTKPKSARIQSAKSWVNSYSGGNIVQKYCQKYKVDKLCAALELRELGANVSDKLILGLRQSMVEKARQARIRKEKRANQEALTYGIDYDDVFSFIAGYTAGGVPYGCTWEETDDDSIFSWQKRGTKSEQTENNPWDDDIPF